MRRDGRKGWGFAVCLFAAALFGAAGIAAAAMDHGGMKMEGSSPDHGGMKMGDKAWAGKIGPWTAEARIMDMKAHMEKAMASGMKMEGAMKSHHIAVELTDPKTKKPVTEGKGTVTVVGPGKQLESSDFMAMQGHFGADVNFPKPGKYTVKIYIESGTGKGAATFAYTLK